MSRPTLASITEARDTLSTVIHSTPLVTSTSLSTLAGCQLAFKPENLQITGSFKIRGAFNKIHHLMHRAPAGVVTASSGNHGQAVAWASRYFKIPAHIVVPTIAPSIKVAAARDFGATVEMCGTRSRERLERAQLIAQNQGYAYIPPYDDPLIMAGQGTIGLEIVSEWPEVDVVLVPIGGGGLISGIATAIKESQPRVKVIGVEPNGAAKAFLSRQNGVLVELESTDSIADGLISLALGNLTYPIIEQYVDELVTVSDEEIRKAFWLLYARLKLVVEPSGAVSAAYALSHGREAFPGQRVVALISGGNVDPATIASLK